MGLNGYKAISDGILVFGCGASDDDAVKGYDEKLIALLQCCRDKVVALNSGKLQLRLKEVVYMRNVLSANGLKLDPEKMKAIQDMPALTDK